MGTTEADFDDRDAIAPGDEYVLQGAGGRPRTVGSGEKPNKDAEQSGLESHGLASGFRAGDAGAITKVAGTQAFVRWHSSH